MRGKWSPTCLTILTLLRETKGGEKENKGKRRRRRVKEVESEENPGGEGTRHTFHFKAFCQLQEKYFKPYFISALLIQIHNKIPAASLT